VAYTTRDRLLEKGDLDQAIADYDQAVARDAQFAENLLKTRAIYYEKGTTGPGHRRL